MDEVTANVSVFLAVLTLALAGLLCVVSAISYRRLASPRLLYVTAAFLVLVVKGGYALYQVAVLQVADVPGSVLDLAVIALLYLSVAKR